MAQVISALVTSLSYLISQILDQDVYSFCNILLSTMVTGRPSSINRSSRSPALRQEKPSGGCGTPSLTTLRYDVYFLFCWLLADLPHNSAKIKSIWMKSGAHCWGLALTDFGCNLHSSDSLRGSWNCFFVNGPEITHDFTDFLSDKFYDIWTQQRRYVRRWKFAKQNFENFTVRGRFSKKCKNYLQNF